MSKSKIQKGLVATILGLSSVTMPSISGANSIATLSWENPTENTDNSTLTNLYRIKVIRQVNEGYPEVIALVDPKNASNCSGISPSVPHFKNCSYSVSLLTGDANYFSLTAVNSLNIESSKSDEVSKTFSKRNDLGVNVVSSGGKKKNFEKNSLRLSYDNLKIIDDFVVDGNKSKNDVFLRGNGRDGVEKFYWNFCNDGEVGRVVVSNLSTGGRQSYDVSGLGCKTISVDLFNGLNNLEVEYVSTSGKVEKVSQNIVLNEIVGPNSNNLEEILNLNSIEGFRGDDMFERTEFINSGIYSKEFIEPVSIFNDNYFVFALNYTGVESRDVVMEFKVEDKFYGVPLKLKSGLNEYKIALSSFAHGTNMFSGEKLEKNPFLNQKYMEELSFNVGGGDGVIEVVDFGLYREK